MEDLGDLALRRWEMTAWCWRGVRGAALEGEGVRNAEGLEDLMGVENIADAICCVYSGDQHFRRGWGL